MGRWAAGKSFARSRECIPGLVVFQANGWKKMVKNISHLKTFQVGEFQNRSARFRTENFSSAEAFHRLYIILLSIAKALLNIHCKLIVWSGVSHVILHSFHSHDYTPSDCHCLQSVITTSADRSCSSKWPIA